MCFLSQLQDGTYTIKDLEVMHQIIQVREHMDNTRAEIANPPPTNIY